MRMTERKHGNIDAADCNPFNEINVTGCDHMVDVHMMVFCNLVNGF